MANVLTLICSSGAVFPSFCLHYPVSYLTYKSRSVFLLFFSWMYFIFDHHVNFCPIQAELFKLQSIEQGFSITRHHKSLQFSFLLLVFNLQATLPMIVACSLVIIHTLFWLCEGIYQSIQYAAFVTDDLQLLCPLPWQLKINEEQ